MAKSVLEGLHVKQKKSTTNKQNRGYAHIRQKKNGGITGN